MGLVWRGGGEGISNADCPYFLTQIAQLYSISLLGLRSANGGLLKRILTVSAHFKNLEYTILRSVCVWKGTTGARSRRELGKQWSLIFHCWVFMSCFGKSLVLGKAKGERSCSRWMSVLEGRVVLEHVVQGSVGEDVHQFQGVLDHDQAQVPHQLCNADGSLAGLEARRLLNCLRMLTISDTTPGIKGETCHQG
jgi:hypothetical protein